MTVFALLLLFVCLPLGTAALEVGTGLAVVAAIIWGRRSERPLLGPVLAVAAVLLVSALGHGSAALVEALGRTWPLALALAVPMLAAGLGEERLREVERVGLFAASLAAVWALVQVALAGQGPWVLPATGPFSHHLTLGYALLVPLARAAYTRSWGFAVVLALGVCAAGGSGPLLSLVVVVAALAWRAEAALAVGVVVALAAIAWLAGDSELHQRAVLWATGGTIAVSDPLGVGPAGFRDAATAVQDAIEPGFHFPYHAHDSALQIASWSGLGAWVAWAWLLVALWQRTGRAGKAAIAGILVGSLTQDTLGDLEVIRPLCAWALLPAALPAGADRRLQVGGGNPIRGAVSYPVEAR